MADKPLGEAIEELTETIKRLESKQSKAKPGRTFGDIMSGINVETFFPSVLSPIGRGGQGVANLIQGTINQFRGRRLSSARAQLEELQSQLGSGDPESESTSGPAPTAATTGSSSFEPISPILENIEHIVHDSYNCLLDIKKILDDGLKMEVAEDRRERRTSASTARVELEEKRESSRPGGLMSSMRNFGIASAGAAAGVTTGGSTGDMVAGILGSLSVSALLPLLGTLIPAILGLLGTIGLPAIIAICGVVIAGILAYIFRDEIAKGLMTAYETIKNFVLDIINDPIGTLRKLSQPSQASQEKLEEIRDRNRYGTRFYPIEEFERIDRDDPRHPSYDARKKQRELDEITERMPSITGSLEELGKRPGQAQSFLEDFEAKFQGQFGGPLRQGDLDRINAIADPGQREIVKQQILEQRRQEFFNSANGVRPGITSPFSGMTLDQIRNISTQQVITSPTPPRNVTPATPPSTSTGGTQTANPGIASAGGKPPIIQTINNIENIFQSSPLLQGTQLA